MKINPIRVYINLAIITVFCIMECIEVVRNGKITALLFGIAFTIMAVLTTLRNASQKTPIGLLKENGFLVGVMALITIIVFIISSIYHL